MTFEDVRRRSYLASMAAGTAAIAGCSGTERDDGEPRRQQPTGGGETGRPQPSPDETARAVRTSADGMVVPVSQGVGPDAAVDPSTTETPIQDAIDVIENRNENGQFGGTVLLPPGLVTEAGPLHRTRHKRFLGWGTFATAVLFTDPESPGIAQHPDVRRDAQQTYWDGIKFLGGGPDLSPGDRTAPWLHLQGHGRANKNSIGGFNVGRIRLDFWGDPVIHFEGKSHIFESHWEWLEMKNTIHGRALLIEDTTPLGGSGWSCDKLNLRRTGPGRIIDARGAGGGSFTVQGLHLMHTRPGGEQDVPAVDLATISGLGDYHFNQIHWENHARPEADNHWMPTLVRASGGQGRLRIGDLVARGGSFDYLVELTENMKHVRLGRLFWGGGELRETPVRLTGDPPQGWHLRGNVVYEGPSDHVTDETGSQFGHVYALGDQRVVDPLYSDTVTHTSGGETRIPRINDVDRQREVAKVTPQVQTLEPATMPEEPFGIDHRFEWIPDENRGQWDLILEWKRDPGIDVEFDVEVTARSADGHGVRLGGRE